MTVSGPGRREVLKLVRRYGNAPFDGFTALQRRYGDTVRLPGNTWLLLDNDDVRWVHTLPTASKHTPIWDTSESFTGTGIFTAEGDDWRARRHAARGLMTPGVLDRVVETTQRHTVSLIENRWAVGRTVPVYTDLGVVSLRTLLEVLFSARVDDDGARELATLMTGLFRRVNTVPGQLIPRWTPLPRNFAFWKDLRQLHRRLEQLVVSPAGTGLTILETARALGAPVDRRGQRTRLRMLDRKLTRWLRTQVTRGRPELGMNERSEILSYVIAGHETTAAAVTSVLRLLAPDQADRAAADSDYRSACVLEAMRLVPPVWGNTRRLEDGGVTPSGAVIPPGALVVLSYFHVHRAWPDPEVFRPERFLGPVAGPFMPFGHGARSCIGRRFALVEAEAMLAEILRIRRLHAVGAPHLDAGLRPSDGAPMRIELR